VCSSTSTTLRLKKSVSPGEAINSFPRTDSTSLV
jgi:hypothetical protein